MCCKDISSDVTSDQYQGLLNVHLYPVMKCFFFSDGTGLYQDDPTTIHSTQELTKEFNLYENDKKSCGMTFTDFSKDLDPAELLD